jgi:predicted nucleic acid-binding protein
VTAAPLICDTGAILDYLHAEAPDHEAFRRAIDRAGTRFIPGLVLAEVDYFLRHERPAMAALVEDMSRGAFTYVPPTLFLIRRAMEIDAQYRDLALGLVDSSVVALAEALRVRRIATRDVRDFGAVRLRDGRALELVIYPGRPDESRG